MIRGSKARVITFSSFVCILLNSAVAVATQNKSRTGKQYVFEDAVVSQEYTVSDPPLERYQFPQSRPDAVYYVQRPPPPPPQSGNYYFSQTPFGQQYQSVYGPPPRPNTLSSSSSSGTFESSILASLLSSGYKPGKPPTSSFGWAPPSGSGSFASASASAGGSSFGFPPSAIASSSSHSHSFGWPRPSPPAPTPTNTFAPTPEYGWGPPKPYPTRPEFFNQFSLKPSAFGWETSYNIPCGNYKIQPRVIAHLRLATQAVIPKPKPKPFEEEGDWRKKRSLYQTQDNLSHLGPFHLERSLHYSPYGQQQFSVPRPTFRPRTCRWNFNAVNECELKFKCGWFQLPALFRCEENYLHVSDQSILLNQKFCGNRRPRSSLASSTGKLTLTFKSEGAALPAIFDCTVICTPKDRPTENLKTSPAPTEGNPTVESSSNIPAFVNQNKQATTSFVSPNNRNTTIIIKTPSKRQLRMANCKCGVPDSHYSSKAIHGRIVGGSTTTPGESSWTAALAWRNTNRIYCGASLINSRYLLTAGHCVAGLNNQTRNPRESGGNGNSTKLDGGFFFDVLLNEHDITQSNEIAGGTIRAKVEKVIVHPQYDNVTFDFDAALLRLVEPVEFNPVKGVDRASALNFKGRPGIHPLIHGTFDFHSLKRKKRFLHPEIEARAISPKPVPICLPEISGRQNRKASIPAPDDFAVVTGWGLTTEGGAPSNEMLKAKVKIFNDTTCQELYKKHNYLITDRMVCAGYLNGKTDSCVGDSGSGLAIEDDNHRFILTGVVSWGRGCGRKQLPGVYTRVTELMDWIYSEAANDDAIWCS